MERIALTVKGMTCGHCVTTVTQALKNVAGVKLAKVTLEEEKAQVTFDPQRASVNQLKDAIHEAGYEVV